MNDNRFYYLQTITNDIESEDERENQSLEETQYELAKHNQMKWIELSQYSKWKYHMHNIRYVCEEHVYNGWGEKQASKKAGKPKRRTWTQAENI